MLKPSRNELLFWPQQTWAVPCIQQFFHLPDNTITSERLVPTPRIRTILTPSRILGRPRRSSATILFGCTSVMLDKGNDFAMGPVPISTS